MIHNIIRPATFTEATRVLRKASNRKGFVKDTGVILDYANIAPRGHRTRKNLQVHGGTKENPVQISVSSGFNTIEVLDGVAVIESRSESGNVVFVHDNADVVIKAPANRKLTIEGRGKVIYKTESHDNRMRDYTEGSTVTTQICNAYEVY